MSDDLSLIARIFAQEVPDIVSGRVEIKAIARKPGFRTKIAVKGREPGVDAIAACVGIRGHRIKRVVDSLGGERIDLIRWTDSPEELIRYALQPAALESVILRPAEHRAIVFVKSDQVSFVQGRGGVNRQLASELTGWQIEVEEV